MKKLNTSNLDLSAAFYVAEDQFKNRLLRFDLDSYAVTLPPYEGAVFAFQSFDFSMILNSISSTICDFVVLESSCVNQDTDGLFEVKVMSEDGVAYSVDSYGNITQLQPLELVDAFGDNAISPVDEWALEPVSPNDRILISRHLAIKLAAYLEGDCKGVFQQLWSEFERNQDTGSKKTHHLHSEFGPFCASELVCGRVLLTTSVEGMFIP
ncbi:hypothetical protein DDZ13_05455 [Coraliomargarita sinensis]|uniref:Uncharacterized protein n=1 Tax=Coraliomargarita sinensis TaxID=2174842 RepID=A0A317ZGQ5_9BACT|nr:hypothetical protein [Coraliomargarita sinensis]PXA04620.1 hypothetical protein DDZ13_05455 [Coraliomargarita sinensis]